MGLSAPAGAARAARASGPTPRIALRAGRAIWYGALMRASLVVCMLLMTRLAHAGVHTSKAGKVSIDVPATWQVNATDELIRAASPDAAVALVLWVVDTTDVKQNLTRLEGELYSSIQGLKWVDRVKKLAINRLPARWIEGAGVNGQAAQLDVLVVIAGPTPSKKGVILMAVVDHGKLDTHKKTIQRTFQTLKAIR